MSYKAREPHTQAVRFGPQISQAVRTPSGYKAGWPAGHDLRHAPTTCVRTRTRGSFLPLVRFARPARYAFADGVAFGFVVRGFAFGFAFADGLRLRKNASVSFACFALSTHVEPFADAGRLYVRRRYARTTFPEIPSLSASSSGRNVFAFAIFFTSVRAFAGSSADDGRSYVPSRDTLLYASGMPVFATVVKRSERGFAFAVIVQSITHRTYVAFPFAFERSSVRAYVEAYVADRTYQADQVSKLISSINIVDSPPLPPPRPVPSRYVRRAAGSAAGRLCQIFRGKFSSVPPYQEVIHA